MGQAKRRGTYEQRQAIAVARQAEISLKKMPLTAEEKNSQYKGQMLLANMMGMLAGLNVGVGTSRR
jgi:hypothetical protein